jgi:5-formyltetrahydrofolate cyclo-ligase
MKDVATIRIEGTIKLDQESNEVVIKHMRQLLERESNTNVTYYIEVKNESDITDFVEHKKKLYEKDHRVVKITTVIKK